MLELLDACPEPTPSEIDARLAAVDPGLRAQVRALLGEGDLPEAFVKPPANPLEELARETVLQPGAKLGSYEILGPLGEGGTGRVYHARQAAPQREVAVKTLRSNLASADSMARFRVEANCWRGSSIHTSRASTRPASRCWRSRGGPRSCRSSRSSTCATPRRSRTGRRRLARA